MAVGSVDRLEEIPDRLAFLFTYDAADRARAPGGRRGRARAGARDVIAALAEVIDAPLVDRETFRAMANRVKERTGQKGQALFHPIRVALTGEGGGPELDLAVPAIERGAALPAGRTVAPVIELRRPRALGVRSRVSERARITRCSAGAPPHDRLRVQRRPRSASREDACGGCASSARSDKRMADSPGAGGAAARCPSSGWIAACSIARSRGTCIRALWPMSRTRRDYAVADLTARGAGSAPLIVVLDGIEDPHNVGAILRTADAAGVSGIVRQTRHAAALDGVVGKASAGALAARAHRHRRQHRARARGIDGGQRLDRRSRGDASGSSTPTSIGRCRRRSCWGPKDPVCDGWYASAAIGLVRIPMVRHGGEPERVRGGRGRACTRRCASGSEGGVQLKCQCITSLPPHAADPS